MVKRVLLVPIVLLLTYGILLAGSWAWTRVPPPHAPCPASGVVVQVDAGARVLALCRDGVEDASFRVALGRGGIDKRLEGDGRTPRGRYQLEQARASGRYRLFLPVRYPTDAQVKQGYSGSAIGVHGPHRAFAWLGHATVWPNWTQGCVAVGTRAEIERIARWVGTNAAREILILSRSRALTDATLRSDAELASTPITRWHEALDQELAKRLERPLTQDERAGFRGLSLMVLEVVEPDLLYCPVEELPAILAKLPNTLPSSKNPEDRIVCRTCGVTLATWDAAREEWTPDWDHRQKAGHVAIHHFASFCSRICAEAYETKHRVVFPKESSKR